MKRFMPVINDIDGAVITFKDGSSFDINERLTIDLNALSSEFASQAAYYGNLAMRFADAQWAQARAKAALEELSAQLDAAYREGYHERNKKYTEAMIKADITLDEDYQELLEHKLELDYHVDVLQGLTRAMDQRGNMLISAGNYTRTEMEMTGSHINEYSESALKEAKKLLAERKRVKSS
jgi:hypothetical protein